MKGDRELVIREEPLRCRMLSPGTRIPLVCTEPRTSHPCERGVLLTRVPSMGYDGCSLETTQVLSLKSKQGVAEVSRLMSQLCGFYLLRKAQGLSQEINEVMQDNCCERNEKQRGSYCRPGR